MSARRAIFLALGILTSLAACERSGVEDERTPSAETIAFQPVIDVHRHASWPGDDDERDQTSALAEMDEANVVLSVLHITSEDDIEEWGGGDRFFLGAMAPCPPLTDEKLFCFPDSDGWPDEAWLEKGFKSGEIKSLGELLFSYYGIAPDAPEMERYWSLAAKYDVPVFVHTNEGPPPGAGPRQFEGCCPNFSDDYGRPALLRTVLENHPDLRISLQHSGLAGLPPGDGADLWDETVALLRDYPNVYLDMTVLNSVFGMMEHEMALKRFIGAGFGDRIMFGTDGAAPADIIARLNGFDFLSPAQRRAIFYDNAARFLRLDRETIAGHYNR